MSTPMIKDGWIESAKKIPSDNYYELENRVVSLLVIHNISLPPGQFGGGYIEQLFTNTLNPDDHEFFALIHKNEVAAHLLIDREGNLTQFVSFDHCAHHAGKSEFGGREKCNDFSIGIELEGTDTEPFTDKQYETLKITTESILTHYPHVTERTITGHSDIAPGRKTDPGPHFDWDRYLNSVEFT